MSEYRDIWIGVFEALEKEPDGPPAAAAAWTRGQKELRELPQGADRDLVEGMAFQALTVAITALEDRGQSLPLLKRVERQLGRQRAAPAGCRLLERLLGPYCPDRAKTVWVPGAGAAYEAKWLAERYPDAEILFLEIDQNDVDEAMEVVRRAGLPKERVLRRDLTRGSEWPEGEADLVLFFHPFVIDHARYRELIELAQKTGTGPDVSAKARLSPDAEAIFIHLVRRLAQGGTLVVTTLDALEAQAVELFLQDSGFQVEKHTMADAPRTVASILQGSTDGTLAIETRHFHHLLKATRP